MRALVLVAALLAAAPAVAEPVDLPVNVADGASWTITTLRVRTTDQEGAPTEIRSESRSRATFRADREGGRLILTPMDGASSADLGTGLRAEGLDFPLEFDVDEAMTPTRMRNWPQLRDAVLAFFVKQSSEGRFADPVKEMYRRMTPEDAPNLFTPHLALLGLGQGLALEVGQPHTYEGEVPNPLGGPSIKSRGSLAIQAHDPKAGRASVVWTQTLDPASLAASLREIGKTMQAGAADDLNVAREERCRFEIDVPTGLAIRTECASEIMLTIQGKSGRRTDRWTITQTLPENP